MLGYQTHFNATFTLYAIWFTIKGAKVSTCSKTIKWHARSLMIGCLFELKANSIVNRHLQVCRIILLLLNINWIHGNEKILLNTRLTNAIFLVKTCISLLKVLASSTLAVFVLLCYFCNILWTERYAECWHSWNRNENFSAHISSNIELKNKVQVLLNVWYVT